MRSADRNNGANCFWTDRRPSLETVRATPDAGPRVSNETSEGESPKWTESRIP